MKRIKIIILLFQFWEFEIKNEHITAHGYKQLCIINHNEKKMTEKELIEFIKEYSEKDIDYIKCDIFEEEDNNYNFRMSICEIVKNDFSICSDKLIIDLFLSLSNSAKKTFGIYRNYQLFANEILNRGHIKYFEIYLEGATKSFDTLIASGIIDLDKEKIIEIIEYLEEKKEKNKYEQMISRFKYLLSKKNFEYP